MQLSSVEVGLTFEYEGQFYAHDLKRRAGSGKIPVKNIKTGEETSLPAGAKVEVVSVQVDEPVVAEEIKEEPSREEMFPAKVKKSPKRELGDPPRESILPSFKEVEAPPHEE